MGTVVEWPALLVVARKQLPLAYKLQIQLNYVTVNPGEPVNPGACLVDNQRKGTHNSGELWGSF